MKNSIFLYGKFTLLITVFFILSLFIFDTPAFSENITLTTYYPAPYGVYQYIRLYPTTTTITCDASTEGTMYYDAASSQVRICSNASGTYQWDTLGWWAIQSGTTIHNINNGNVTAHGTWTWDASTTHQMNGRVHASGSDLAEYILVDDEVEPGDVVLIDEVTGKVKKAHQAYSSKVAGIISEEPAIIFGKIDPDQNYAQLVLTGQAPCKVTSEAGKIEPGDLLISSSKPGYAMKAEFLSYDDARSVSEVREIFKHNEKIQMSVIGKALEPLEADEGKINILIK